MNTIKRGSVGDDVRTLQRILGIAVDGLFGAKTEQAVKDFQTANKLVADGIVGNNTWAKLLAVSDKPITAPKRSTRTINEIIVHCAATPEGKDYTVADITRWHTNPISKGGRGWKHIGYHYVIYRDGTIHLGCDVNIDGIHCTGHNRYSIAVCYVGGMDAMNKKAKDTRTQAQKAALERLLRQLRTLYPSAKIYGHRDFANKECPSFDAKNEYRNI